AIARLNENLKAYNATETRGHKLAFSIGVATLEPERMTCFEELLEQADQAMYEQKRMKRRRAAERTEKQLGSSDTAETQSDSPFASNSIPFAISSNPKAYGASHGTFDNAAIGMAVVSMDGSWLQVNEALCKLLGYSEQELRASNFQVMTHPEDLRHV